MGTTEDLAGWLVASRPDDIPADVVHEARRALVNIVGCALGGARHPAVDITIDALGAMFGPPDAAVLGRPERADPLHAALLNGITSHVEDFDDTLPRNYIHASSPVASALLAYASANRVSGRDLVHAFVLGFEATSRLGNATYPSHYTAGWHSTGSVGVFGAAIAIGTLLGLTQEDDLGDRPGRDPGRGRARAVRLDGQGAASRAAPRRTATPPRCWRRGASRAACTASRARAAGRR